MEVPASDTFAVQARRIASMDELQMSPWGAVSPDGRLYVAQGPECGLGIRDVESGEVRTTEDRMNQILHLSVEDGSLHVLRTLPWSVRPGHLAVSPDGRYLAYDAPDEGQPEGPRHVYALALDGSRETRLVGGPSEDVLLGWAPGGTHLIFGSDRAGTMGAWLLPVTDGRAAGEPVLVKPGLWNIRPLDISPDGRRVAFLELRGPDWVLAVADLESGRTTEHVTFPRGGGTWPGLAWSADGRFLLYAHHFRDAEAPYRRELRRLPVEGGEPEPMGLEGEVISTLALHPDGRRLVYEAGAQSWELWVLEGLPGGVVGGAATSEVNRE